MDVLKQCKSNFIIMIYVKVVFHLDYKFKFWSLDNNITYGMICVSYLTILNLLVYPFLSLLDVFELYFRNTGNKFACTWSVYGLLRDELSRQSDAEIEWFSRELKVSYLYYARAMCWSFNGQRWGVINAIDDVGKSISNRFGSLAVIYYD